MSREEGGTGGVSYGQDPAGKVPGGEANMESSVEARGPWNRIGVVVYGGGTLRLLRSRRRAFERQQGRSGGARIGVRRWGRKLHVY